MNGYKKLWYIYTMEYYSAIRNNDFTKFLRKWIHLENIILSEITQSQKDRHHMQSLIIGYWSQNALNTPKRTHRLWSSRRKKEKKRKNHMLNPYTPRKLWLIPGYILFYMYFMLIVTSKILMHTIKPLKKKAMHWQKCICTLFAKMFKICSFIFAF